ncbi:hypothetical protein GUITHDRAFT_112460 [Guillardia theta CCMP2712]|uniref:Uncharacterized protein n=1 Tax=Guillardia theta (strain CCMP2712) TaxID=905079 RepID=L1IZZ8_GUITC|nr:hypothetical protein GUITHDRAFT_112460 [Guillardia theta CCMP2712]EKX41489.1 hypothetical protein GUITHDRAFT_112460 [Guillardia theta CCMP2712]|eukprot:XP_005828469.1 hypothetical protein GUITHDRAFT_112460 [Guillardia theta CCMP2712]
MHHCVVNAVDNKQLKKVLMKCKEGASLITSCQYSKATNVFTKQKPMMESNSSVAWVVANGLGLALHLSGSLHAADHELKNALRNCESLSSQGYTHDAYTDLAGCLNDLAVNESVMQLEEPSSQPVKRMKRARYMAERAYRPNQLVLHGLDSNLTLLQAKSSLQEAKLLAEKNVKATSFFSPKKDNRDNNELRFLHAKNLAMLADLRHKTGSIEEGLETAERAREMLEVEEPSDVLEAARTLNVLGNLFWTAACVKRKVGRGTGAEQQEVNAGRVYERCLAMMGDAGFRKSHPDYLAVWTNSLVVRRWTRGFQEIEKERLSCLRSVRLRGKSFTEKDQWTCNIHDSLLKIGKEASRKQDESFQALISIPPFRVGFGLFDVVNSLEGKK